MPNEIIWFENRGIFEEYVDIWTGPDYNEKNWWREGKAKR